MSVQPKNMCASGTITLILVAIFSATITSSYVIIKNPSSELVVTSSDTNITVETYQPGNDKQLWTFETALKGRFFIINKAHGKALQQIQNTKYTVLEELEECRSQQWYVNSDQTIVNAATGDYLDIQGSAYEDGTFVIAYEVTGGPNQNFVLETECNYPCKTQ